MVTVLRMVITFHGLEGWSRSLLEATEARAERYFSAAAEAKRMTA
jgi:hypothetical protein